MLYAAGAQGINYQRGSFRFERSSRSFDELGSPITPGFVEARGRSDAPQERIETDSLKKKTASYLGATSREGSRESLFFSKRKEVRITLRRSLAETRPS